MLNEWRLRNQRAISSIWNRSHMIRPDKVIKQYIDHEELIMESRVFDKGITIFFTHFAWYVVSQWQIKKGKTDRMAI